MIHRSTSYTALAILAVAVLGACILDGETPPTPGNVPATSIATFTPTPRSLLTPGPTPTPSPTPVVATGEQARLRTWLAVYTCFQPSPELGSFTAYQDSPQRWIVEGRPETTTAGGETTTISYGLWLVDAYNGDIIPYDPVAKSIKANTSCFREP